MKALPVDHPLWRQAGDGARQKQCCRHHGDVPAITRGAPSHVLVQQILPENWPPIGNWVTQPKGWSDGSKRRFC